MGLRLGVGLGAPPPPPSSSLVGLLPWLGWEAAPPQELLVGGASRTQGPPPSWPVAPPVGLPLTASPPLCSHGAVLESGDKYGLSEDGAELTVRDVRKVDEGEYTCLATNKAGQKAQEVSLGVFGKGTHASAARAWVTGHRSEVSAPLSPQFPPKSPTCITRRPPSSSRTSR